MKKIATSLLICTALGLIASCDDFMDIHKDFIKDGEIIYAPKVDSTAFIAGKGRILFRFWLYNSPNVKTVDLYWNSKTDSLLIPVTPSSGIDSIEIIIPDLEEKSYTFDVRTTDNFDHKSLWTTNFGNAYGTSYEETLMERRVREVALEENKGTITFFTGISDMVRTEVRYLTNSGETNQVSTSRSDNELLCPDAKAGSSFEFRSLFIPEEESIDMFALEWQMSEIAFPDIYLFDRSNWKVLSVSDETASDGGGIQTLLDGDLGTYWHSQWDGGDAPLPHWAIIDMQFVKDIKRIDTYRRAGNTDTKDIEYYIGTDPNPNATAWVKIGVGQYPNSAQDALVIEIDKSVDTKTGRYLKLVLPTSYRDPFTSIAEINVYGGGNN